MAINADESREIVEHYTIFGIPAIIQIQDGDVIGSITGALSEAQYRQFFGAAAAGQTA